MFTYHEAVAIFNENVSCTTVSFEKSLQIAFADSVGQTSNIYPGANHFARRTMNYFSLFTINGAPQISRIYSISKFALRSGNIFNTRYFWSKMAVPHALPTMTPLHLPKNTRKTNCTYVEITRLYSNNYSDQTLNSFIAFICTLLIEILFSLMLTKCTLTQWNIKAEIVNEWEMMCGYGKCLRCIMRLLVRWKMT